MCNIGFKINSGNGIIGATNRTFNMPVKNDWIKVLKIKTVFSAKNNTFKQADIQPLGNIYTKVVHGSILAVEQSITGLFKLRHQFHE